MKIRPFNLSFITLFIALTGSPAIWAQETPPPANGEYIRYFPNGKMMSKETYVNGELNGPAFEYHENGKVDNMSFYVDGKLHGQFKSFHEDGTRFEEATYVNDQLQGVYRCYYPNGNLEREDYYVDDELQGMRKEYYESGELLSEEDFTSGERQGEGKAYFKNGQVENRFMYKDDIPVEMKTFDKLGNFKKEIDMSHKQKHLIKKQFEKAKKATEPKSGRTIKLEALPFPQTK